MSKIALIGCTSKKQDHTCPAIEMYSKSSYFNKKLKYCKNANIDIIFILSAKYGLLDPDTIIEPYNVFLKNQTKDYKLEWNKRVLEDLRNKTNMEKDEFIILAGNEYVKDLLEFIPNHYNPVKGLGIGYQSFYFQNFKSEINAKDLRNESERLKIENQPGFYKWWAKKEEFDLILEKLNIDFEDIKGEIEKRNDYYSIYVGIAANESIRDRLNWHVNDLHTESKVKNGTLSTFRQSISSIIVNDQSNKECTDEFIDKLKIEYFTLDLPIKSEDAKYNLEKFEKLLMDTNLYVLNIRDNHHFLAKPIKKQLKALRKKAKENGLKAF